MNEAYRLRYTNQIVGMFLLIFLLFLIGLSLLVFRVSDRFGTKDRFWLRVDESEIRDLYPGAEVIILGETAGEVRSIDYEAQQRTVRVDLVIDRESSDKVFDDSVVRLERKFGVGAPVLAIRRGGPEAGRPVPLPPGSQIENFESEMDRVDQLSQEVELISESIRAIQQAAEPSLSSVDQAAERFRGMLDDSADPAFDSAQQASRSFLETNQQFRAAISNLEARIEALTKTIQALMNQDMRQTLVEVQESSNDLSEAAQSVNQTSDRVNQDVAETLERMREAIEQVRLLAEEAREVGQVVRREVNELPGTAARVSDTVSETQDLVGEIRSHWLLRRSSKQATPSSQVSPSAVRGGTTW